jgi:hypothetical protein
MPDSLLGVLIAIALVLPGFTIVQLSRSGRATGDESELELILRALFYALVLHAAFSWWTKDLVESVGSFDNWPSHLGPILLYTGTVLVVVPVITGLALGAYLRTVEAKGKTGTWYAVLGARDARDSFDYLFQRLRSGGWLIVEMSNDQFVGGKYGTHSSVGQSPASHNLYLEEMWWVQAHPIPVLQGPIHPTRGIWIRDEDVRAIHVISPPHLPGSAPGAVESEDDG